MLGLLGGCKIGDYALVNPFVSSEPIVGPVAPVAVFEAPVIPKAINTEDSTIYPQPSAFSSAPVPLQLDDATASVSVPPDKAADSSRATGTTLSVLDSGAASEDADALDVVGAVRNAAARSLVAKAQRLGGAGKAEPAIALYERALKIDAFDPWLLHGLARLQVQQKRFASAQSLAARSQVMNYEDSRLGLANATLLREIEAAMGMHP